ncbi:DUF3833 domain-containing protein [Microbulbifer agarilyticus]|uniref:DUF3833 domain-containing protein n=1 Tax=Microbulbifer agarilyticus TaxID=260552 RepID=UPI001CD3DA27|nr:DUF3833 domain-containing protein [Microbulbifer agarilyticus]MCA0893347.1 DUF3833 domain-containing protein [Microbulbifer agarilyticus]
MIKALALFFTVLLAISGCSAPSIESYADKTPRFVAEEFFSGPMKAYGVVKDRSGAVTRKFVAELNGSWEDGRGILREKFEFDDGEIQYRNWVMVPNSQASVGPVRAFTATAEDVVGESTMRTAGNAVFMRYVLQVPYKGRTLDLNVDDRMYLVAPNILIAESKLSKWGFNVGEIQLTIVK